MTNKKRILIVIPSLKKGGGAEKNGYLLGNIFSPYYEIRYLTFYDGTQFDSYKSEHYEYSLNEQTKKSVLSKPYHIIKRLQSFKTITKNYKPDVVISLMFDANILVALASPFRKYKVILSLRNDIEKLSRFKKIISIFLYKKMDFVHTLTKQMEYELNLLGIDNTFTIYNGHDLESYKFLANEKLDLDIDKGDFLFLNIGRLNYAKGQWHLIKAFSLLIKTFPSLKLAILGDGLLQKELENLIENLGIKENVFLVGRVENIFPYIKRADCFCFTSLYEGLPNVLIETLALNKPIISTDCLTGPREILAPHLDVNEKISYPYISEKGILTHPFSRDSVDFSTLTTDKEKDYANIMKIIISHSQILNNEKESVKRFSIDTVSKQWINRIEKVINES